MERQGRLDDESFKFRALSAGAVTAFDGQTEIHSLPSDLNSRSPGAASYRPRELLSKLKFNLLPQ